MFESGEKYAQIKHHLQAAQSSSKWICHGRKHYYELGTNILARSHGLKFKCLNDGFVYYTAFHFTRHSFMDWSHVDYLWITVMFYQLFGLSFWRHPFTAEHPLVSKWCNATFLQIWWRNKLIYILDSLRVSTFSEIFSILGELSLILKCENCTNLCSYLVQHAVREIPACPSPTRDLR